MKPKMIVVKTTVAVMFVALLAGMFSFRTPATSQASFRTAGPAGYFDTTARRQRIGTEMERSLEQLDNALAQLDADLANLDGQLKQNLEQSVTAELERALDQLQQSNQQLEQHLQHPLQLQDTTKPGAQRRHQMAEVQRAKAEVQRAAQQVRKQQLHLQGTLHPGVHRQMAHAKGQMATARVEMAKARVEMQQMKLFIEVLEKDGLIDTSKPFEVEVKDNWLHINGTKQPEHINDKYRQYYKQNHFHIKQNGRAKRVEAI